MRADLAVYLLLLSLTFGPAAGPGDSPFQKALDKAESSYRSGDFEAAAGHLRKALDFATNAAERISLLSRMGLIYWNLGKIDDSQGFYARALALAEKNKGEEEIARLRDIAGIYAAYQAGKDTRAAGDLEGSVAHFDRAVALARSARSPEHEVKCLRQLSASHHRLNRPELFFKLNTEALRLAVRARLELEQEYCLYNLGLYHQSTGNFPAALDHFSRAYDLAVRLGDASEQSSCLLSLGAVHLEIGNFDRAAEKLEAAL
ncbi:MAG: tetratricopeptide repeat protein, partial [Candidatus Aminicenantes bacterium]|nr:tetratricopeptide repeat protein [Candidatus Aminicenantes bacterium]